IVRFLLSNQSSSNPFLRLNFLWTLIPGTRLKIQEGSIITLQAKQEFAHRNATVRIAHRIIPDLLKDLAEFILVVGRIIGGQLHPVSNTIRIIFDFGPQDRLGRTLPVVSYVVVVQEIINLPVRLLLTDELLSELFGLRKVVDLNKSLN